MILGGLCLRPHTPGAKLRIPEQVCVPPTDEVGGLLACGRTGLKAEGTKGGRVALGWGARGPPRGTRVMGAGWGLGAALVHYQPEGASEGGGPSAEG